MNTSDVLNKAADLIEERGWVQGPGWDWDGRGGTPLCLEGAIGAASGIRGADTHRPFNECDAGRAVRAYLDMTPNIAPRIEWTAAPNLSNSPLYRWNDQWHRTAAEVIEVLRATAVIEAARESEAAELVTIEVASIESARAEL